MNEFPSGSEARIPTLGFKELTASNFLQIDEVMEAFVTIDPAGDVRQVPPHEWAAEILNVRLGVAVPLEVHRLFAVARGAMLYGHFFYPLYALASEQLFRVAEAGLSLKCRELAAPAGVDDFSRRIDWLKSCEFFSEEKGGLWHALRELRNSASHPADQLILPPGHALTLLRRVADDVDGLFRPSGSVKVPLEPDS